MSPGFVNFFKYFVKNNNYKCANAGDLKIFSQKIGVNPGVH